MKPQSNTEFVSDVMDYSVSGPIMQVFVIEALRYYSELVVKNGLPKEDPLSLISPVTWYNTAKELNEKLKEKYEPKTVQEASGNLPQQLS